MAKSFLKKLRKYRTIILIASIIAFILLVILGFVLGPAKTWEPGANQNQTQGR